MIKICKVKSAEMTGAFVMPDGWIPKKEKMAVDRKTGASLSKIASIRISRRCGGVGEGETSLQRKRPKGMGSNTFLGCRVHLLFPKKLVSG